MQRLLIRAADLINGSPAKHDKLVYFSLFFSFLLNFIIWFLIIIAFWNADEYVILQYNMYFGISSFGHWFGLLMLPVMGLIITLINGFLSFQIYLEYRILARILSVMTTLINIILIIVVSLLIYINF